MRAAIDAIDGAEVLAEAHGGKAMVRLLKELRNAKLWLATSQVMRR